MKSNIFVILVIGTILISCAATMQIQSNKDELYNKKISKVLVLHNINIALSYEFVDAFEAGLITQFSDEDIEVNIEKFNPGEDNDLSLSTPDDIFSESVLKHKPETVLVISSVSLTSSSDGMATYVSEVKFDASLYDKTKQRVWRAAIEYQPRSVLYQDSSKADKFLNILIDKMREDGLI